MIDRSVSVFYSYANSIYYSGNVFTHVRNVNHY